MKLLVFESSQWRRLRPLTDLLPTAALAFGASDLTRRWLAWSRLPLHAIEARPGVMAAWSAAPAPDSRPLKPETPLVVVDACALPGPWFDAALAERRPALWMSAGRLVGGIAPARALHAGLGRGPDFETVLLSVGMPVIEVEARMIERPWHLLEWNAAAIEADLGGLEARNEGRVHATACLESPDRIHIDRDAVVGPLVVIDAGAGPVRVARGARISAHSLISGPCVIGPGTQILGGSISGSTFGPECRVAGEVEASVWQGHANKRHHGFVGHSWVGEWVNLGALTTTSDLKNNYGPVRLVVDGADVDSGSPKVGSLIGCHAKTGIGSLMPTGAVVGTGAHLFGGGRFAPKSVPSFGWWDGEHMVVHDLEKCLRTAGIAMSRRGRALMPADEAALRALFASTLGERPPMTRA